MKKVCVINVHLTLTEIIHIKVVNTVQVASLVSSHCMSQISKLFATLPL